MLAWGVSFVLILTPSGCAPEYGMTNTLGCVEYWKSPPKVYMRPNLNTYWRRFVLRHEVGHIVCSRLPVPDLSERCADRWAKQHMPTRKRKAKR